MVFSVLCFFFKPASWHLLLYQYRSIHFDAHISKQHSPIKSRVPCAPFILWAPAPPKVSARPWTLYLYWSFLRQARIVARRSAPQQRLSALDATKQPVQIMWTLCQYVINRTMHQFTVGICCVRHIHCRQYRDGPHCRTQDPGGEVGSRPNSSHLTCT